ncbi:MAG: signal peptidase II [Candidatus Omnitrophica bacterium]|nr:signal peptidase II [Candidatus Omnitrophota bacterium]
MLFIIAASILLFDQLLKFLSLKYLTLNNSVPLIKGILHLTLVYNRGAAFGILKNQVPFFILTTVAAFFLICINLKKSGLKKLSLYNLSLILILAGATGNLVDRLLFGYVVDFIDLRIWPVFNIADSSITVGAVLLGWDILKGKSQK